MTSAQAKHIKWAGVLDAEFEVLTNVEISQKYGCTVEAAKTERRRRKMLGRVSNGLVDIRKNRSLKTGDALTARLDVATPTLTPMRYDLPTRDISDPFAVFKHEAWGEVRTVRIDDEVWFVGKDVADILKYTNSRQAISDHVDPDDTLLYRIDTGTGAGLRDMTFINPTGVIYLVARSKMPNAKKFQRWLFGEVTPSLMQTGTYTIAPQMMTQQDETAALIAQTESLIRCIRAKDGVIALQAGELAQTKEELTLTSRERDCYRDRTFRVQEYQNPAFFAMQFHKNGIHLSAKTLNALLVEQNIGSMRNVGGHKRYVPYIDYVNKGWYVSYQVEYKPGKYRDQYELTSTGRQAVAELMMKLGYRISGSPSDHRCNELF